MSHPQFWLGFSRFWACFWARFFPILGVILDVQGLHGRTYSSARAMAFLVATASAIASFSSGG